MLVCHCEVINDVAIHQLIAEGTVTADDIAAQCGAGSKCGGCAETIQWLIDQRVRKQVAGRHAAREQLVYLSAS